MVVSRQDTGRTNQKQRTRRAIIQAAAELVREGASPTVADAAERALVSRATAYRYFPTQQSLLVELQADATQPSPAEVFARAGDDVEARVEAMTRELARSMLQDEALFRNQIRVMQDQWFARRGDTSIPVREGRRLAWIDEALEPVAAELGPQTLTSLRRALALVVGVEPVISLRDVCGLSPEETEATLAWTALAVLRSVVDQHRSRGAASAGS
jgi:AcrR family transcriptional regulator